METSRETTSAKTSTGATLFKRKRRIGFEPISCNEDKPVVFVEIKSATVESLYSKKLEKDIPFVDVIDMETGLENRLWLSGQLRHNLMEFAESVGTLKGLKVEINWTGMKKMEIDGEKVEVNQYRLFEVD